MSEVINWHSARIALAEREMDILARTIWGEARGEGQRGMEAVAAVIINRVTFAREQPCGSFWWGNSIIRVCQKPMQFSCWNAQDANLAKLKNVDQTNPSFAMAQRIAKWATTGSLPDATGGADHYHALYVSPKWASGQTPTAVIGKHVFYKLMED
ncbi:MAG TPA: cell wall hydrolase [Alphaproteobacteria bacterium]|nr:cell wall hydrolase [Rhodospirillaceae bacterium]HRJ12152.1 cell wall hydrolase [Alphaproteobacteria bacterium]